MSSIFDLIRWCIDLTCYRLRLLHAYYWISKSQFCLEMVIYLFDSFMLRQRKRPHSYAYSSQSDMQRKKKTSNIFFELLPSKRRPKYYTFYKRLIKLIVLFVGTAISVSFLKKHSATFSQKIK